jgi:DNA-binding GntR family transcriptional regulator
MSAPVLTLVRNSGYNLKYKWYISDCFPSIMIYALARPTSLLTAHHPGKTQGAVSQGEQAYLLIKRGIIRLEYPPASLLNEAELMRALGIGRTPIREALQRLALENLVVILPRRGTMVADLNLSDLQKISEVRLELETFAACLAAERARPEHLVVLDNLLVVKEDISESDDHHQMIELDHQFHQVIAEAAGNEFLAGELRGLYNHVIRLWYHALHKVIHPLGVSLNDHARITAAIKAGDGEHAAKIMRAHITSFQVKFRAVL